MRSQNIKLYREYKPWFGVNLGDRNLNPVYISLPTPPPKHMVAGFGKHPDDQYFRRLEIPPKLKTLENRIITELQAANDRDRFMYY